MSPDFSAAPPTFATVAIRFSAHSVLAEWAAAGSMDTGLSFWSFLELYKTDVTERRTALGRVVKPLDVIEHISPGLLPSPESPPGFQEAPTFEKTES